MYHRTCWTADRESFVGDQPIVVTTADRPDHPGLINFLLTLRKLGYANVHILEADPIDFKKESEFWALRLSRYTQFTRDLPRSAIVVFVDSYDMLFFGPPKLLVQRFKEFTRGQVVFAAEMLCDTFACRTDLFLRNVTKPGSKFLNAGGIVGSPSDLLWLFQEASLLSNGGFDDQAAFAKLYRDFPHRITLDRESRLFGVVPPARDLFLDEWDMPGANRTDIYAPTKRGSGEMPVAFHFAGLRIQLSTFNQCQNWSSNLYNSLVQMVSIKKDALLPKSRVVVSLTSIPPRYQFLNETLQSLMSQSVAPDAIYLNIPQKYHRKFDRGALELPSFLKSLDKVHINVCDDFGPATKLIPTLHLEQDPSTVIISVDDDMAYHPEMISTLLQAYYDWPHAAYGFAGQMIDMADGLPPVVRSAHYYSNVSVPVDILEAFLGALYKRGWFDSSFAQSPEPCRSTDDIWISQHLSSKGIPRIKLKILPGTRPKFTANDKIAPLREVNLGGVRNNDRCSRHALPAFQKSWTKAHEPCPLNYKLFDIPKEQRIDDKNPGYRSTLTSPCSPTAFVQPTSPHALQPAEFLVNGKELTSPSGQYRLLLNASRGMCFSGGGRDDPSAECFPGKLKSEYSSLYLLFHVQGRVCMYNGSTPYVRQRTGPLFCSEPTLPRSETMTAKLKVTDDGRFGIFWANGTMHWGGRIK